MKESPPSASELFQLIIGPGREVHSCTRVIFDNGLIRLREAVKAALSAIKLILPSSE
jgi:hypothetical protein